MYYVCFLQEYEKVVKDSEEKAKLANQVYDLVSSNFTEHCQTLHVSSNILHARHYIAVSITEHCDNCMSILI